MFLHNFKYTLKVLFKNRALIFWTFIFPIVLGTFFKMAFSNIESSEQFSAVKIAIIDNDEYKSNLIYKNSFAVLGDENNKERVFEITYTDKDKANELLEKEKIVGYLEIKKGKPKIVFYRNGIEQTIFKYVVDELVQTNEIINNTVEDKTDYKKIYAKVIEINSNNAKINNISNKNLSYTMIEYYTLLAMACLYGAMISMTAINNNLANMSSKGMRVSVSPTPKFKVVLSSLLSSYVIQLIGLVLLFIYTIFILKVDYGDRLPLVILLTIVGSLSGLSLGLFSSSVIKSSENTKIGIIMSITMAGCFFAGMMGITMKYIIDTNIPLLNKINPVAIITDGYYSLYYYSTLNRFYFDLISLLIFSGILISISMITLRRQKYDSI